MKKITLFMLPLLFGGIAHAEEKKSDFNPNDVSIFGGQVRCTMIVNWLKSSNQNDLDKIDFVISYYTQGYLSAYNLMKYALSPHNIPSHLGTTLNMEYNVEYVRNYCLTHPKDGMSDAVMTLVGALQ